MNSIMHKHINSNIKHPIKPEISIQTGDILFLTKSNDLLSQAIDLVTQTTNNTHFTHMGIAEVTNVDTTIYHAKPKTGVCAESLSQFTQQHTHVVIYRLKPELHKWIPYHPFVDKLSPQWIFH